MSEDEKKTLDLSQEFLDENNFGDFKKAAPLPVAKQPLNDLSPNQTQSHPLLHFTIEDETKSMFKNNYHPIKPQELKKLNRYALNLQNAAQWYLDELADSKISYFYVDNREIKTLQVSFLKENFLHLTGIYPLKENQSAEKSIDDFARGLGSFDNILISNRGAAFDKIQVLPQLPDLIEAQAFVFDDLSEVERFKRLNTDKAIRALDKDVALAIRTIDDTNYPASLLKLKSKINIELDQIDGQKIILGVFRERNNELEQLSINEEFIKDGGNELLDILKNETLQNEEVEKSALTKIEGSSEKQEYIDLIKEAIEDGELSETTNLEEAIYIIDGLKISGEFDYGVRGLDHNALIFDEQKWADVLQWGTVIVPETTSYISDNIIPELDELGYQAVPLLENHKYQIDEKDLVQIDQTPNEIQVENIKTSISSKLSEIQTLNSLEDVAKISGEIDTLEGQLEEVSAQSIEGSEPSVLPLSLQELIAQKDLKGIEAHIKSGIENYLDSDTFKNYLDFARQFRQYSYRNKILIKGQNPKASFVAGYRAWQEKGRQVQRGQKALKIFVPNLAAKKDKDGNYSRDKEGNIIKEVKGFYLASVYDVSQTEGEPIPKPIYELEENINNPQKFDWYIKAITELSPVPIQFSEIEGTAKGFFVPVEKQITIRPGMSQSQTIKTMLHEITHSLLHDNDVPIFGSPEYARQEIEAESVAYMVANSLGIETQDYSFGYLASWTDLGLSLENLEKSLDLICSQAQKMMGELDNILKQTPIEEQTPVIKPAQKQTTPRPKSSIKMHM
ncbi:hypothetical protein IL308_11225 [Lactococcus lactis]|uniref:PBECR4 domain-containing protein n=1 Tax=Lactococcus lactis TaxID=1358 RepID=UPI001911F40E|nr:hypothetical protein [Lactococcus lactis]